MLFYNLTPFLGVADSIIAAMFVVSPFITFWMAYKILKDATPSHKTFDDCWYEDYQQ